MPRGGSAPGERRGGRQRGTPNKLTGDLRAMILGALEDAGGRDYLKLQAFENPAAFMSLLAKALPMQVTGENTGALLVDFRWADSPSEATAPCTSVPSLVRPGGDEPIPATLHTIIDVEPIEDAEVVWAAEHTC
jgi:hypothetical protein